MLSSTIQLLALKLINNRSLCGSIHTSWSVQRLSFAPSLPYLPISFSLLLPLSLLPQSLLQLDLTVPLFTHDVKRDVSHDTAVFTSFSSIHDIYRHLLRPTSISRACVAVPTVTVETACQKRHCNSSKIISSTFYECYPQPSPLSLSD